MRYSDNTLEAPKSAMLRVLAALASAVLLGFVTLASATAVGHVIRGTSEINLEGSGQSPAKREARTAKQIWVMENVPLGSPWREQVFVSRLGPYRKSNSTLSRAHGAYYFPQADITIIVDELENLITVWRLGRARK